MNYTSINRWSGIICYLLIIVDRFAFYDIRFRGGSGIISKWASSLCIYIYDAMMTSHGGRSGRALVLHAGDHGIKPRSSQTND